ncbi:MAG TPA: 4Fe-4S binding protein [Longimicrobiales bacterium]|nr:4Fe-4S binding protein [Longimicrobiales bacterium]
MNRVGRTLLLALLAPGLAAVSAAAQGVDRVRPSLVREVMPEADSVADAEGSPPVRRAYRGGELIGYVFLTSDLPPEERGYSGPIRAVVGMTPDGTLTGVRVTEYRESYMSTKGDFLRRPGFQEQYAGKYIGDGFRVYDDVDGISKVSVSVRALSRGVRDAARRVAAAYPPERPRPTEPVGDVLSMSWFVMRQAGVAARMDVTAEGEAAVGISLIHLESEELARYLVGGLYQYVLDAVERRGRSGELILYAVDGPGSRLAVQQGWSIEQGGVVTEIPYQDVVMLGSPWEGLLSGETSIVGVIILDETVDVAAPLRFSFRRAPDLVASVEYTSQRALALMAEADPPVEAAAIDTAATTPAPAPSPAAARTDPTPSTTPAAAAAAASPSPEQLVQLDFTLADEESALELLLGGTSWSRVAWTVSVLTLATLAFVTKLPSLRWISLAATLGILGFVDGGFLSISHLTGVIWVGPSAILGDLPLLLMVAFTLVTLVLVGRVFCGFLCPFGALQDFLDRIVPARFKRELPKGVHRWGLKAKYGVLALIVLPAMAGLETSLYQYFEPFGTVFFLSTNLTLWTIAGGVLLASAVVPRFYCRYACPLGAALALGSVLSWRRIPRVEQCDHCKVCEQKCPTGAIAGPVIDFKECVRCNVCEVQLIERTGACKHDMEAIRPRLVHLKVAAARVAGPAS